MAMSGIAKSHYLWAAVCAIGYFSLLSLEVFNALQPLGIILLWVVLGAIGIYGMYKWVPMAPLNKKIIYAWAAVTVVGLVINALQLVGMVPLTLTFNYATVWLILTAIGFAYTGYVWPKAKEANYIGAAANALGALGILAGIEVVLYNSILILGLASVLPLVYAGMKN